MPHTSRSLCVLPWIHTYVSTTGWVQLCCVSGAGTDLPPSYGNIGEKSIHELFRSSFMQRVRKQMLEGEWPAECAVCQQNEAMGLGSFRQVHNDKYKEQFQELMHEGSHVQPAIRTIDIRISNACNFSCRTCSGFASSSWYKDHNAIYPENKVPQPLLTIQNSSRFWEEFERDIIPNLVELHIAGGEPLMIDKHYQILELLIQKGKTDVELYYDTNLSRLTYKKWNILELWKIFPKIQLSLSLDGVGKQGEYIRSGLNYNQWCHNLKQVISEVPHAFRMMHFVISVFNILNLQHHYDTIIQNGFVSREGLGFTLLEWPSYLNIQALHPKLKELAEQRLRAMRENDALLNEDMQHFIDATISFMHKTDLYPEQGHVFVKKTRMLDKRRNQNVLDIFPELELMFEASD